MPPVFAVQFHPEKPTFEWGTTHSTPHDADSIAANNYLANFYVEQCRASKREMSDETYNLYSIWNFQPEFSGKNGGYFEQQYYWSSSEIQHVLGKKVHGRKKSYERRVLSILGY